MKFAPETQAVQMRLTVAVHAVAWNGPAVQLAAHALHAGAAAPVPVA